MPPSGPPGPGNLYRLPPSLVGTACTLYTLFNDVSESCEFRGGWSGTFLIYLFVYNLLQGFWWLQAMFLVHLLSVCMCVFPCSAPHVLPNFNSPCLIHCPSLLLVNGSKSSGYGCEAGFVFFSVITGGLRCVHGLQNIRTSCFLALTVVQVYGGPRIAE